MSRSTVSTTVTTSSAFHQRIPSAYHRRYTVERASALLLQRAAFMPAPCCQRLLLLPLLLQRRQRYCARLMLFFTPDITLTLFNIDIFRYI